MRITKQQEIEGLETLAREYADVFPFTGQTTALVESFSGARRYFPPAKYGFSRDQKMGIAVDNLVITCHGETYEDWEQISEWIPGRWRHLFVLVPSPKGFIGAVLFCRALGFIPILEMSNGTSWLAWVPGEERQSFPQAYRDVKIGGAPPYNIDDVQMGRAAHGR